MESLDTTGQNLYKAYITARDAWISYIRPYAIIKLNEYLSQSGRKFNKYEYYADTTHGYMKDKDILIPSKSKPKTPDTIAKYKKLSLLFHPDKFKHPSSSALFCQIKKWFDGNDTEMLDILDMVAHLILEVPSEPDTLSNLLANLSNVDILDVIHSHFPSPNTIETIDARKIFELLNTDPAKLLESSHECHSSNEAMKPENFINTNAYRFFMDETGMKPEINEMALTESEIIEYIKVQGQYDEGFLEFYLERYCDNENILRTIVEIRMRKNEELKKENERLRARIDGLQT